MMSVRERAALMATKANECCHRSDDYEDDLAKFFFEHIDAAVKEEREAFLDACDAVYGDRYHATRILAYLDKIRGQS